MSGDLEIDDAEASDGASDNDYSDHEHLQDPLSLVKDEDQHANMAEQKLHPDAADNGETVPPAKPKFDPKDPLRPRRKKARRACFACQRAHLTCGMHSFSALHFRTSILDIVMKPLPSYCTPRMSI